MPNLALLALEASDGTVVLTSITLVFAMLIALCLIITLEGKLFDLKNKKPADPKPQAPAAPAAKAAPAPAAKPAAPAAKADNGGIPGAIWTTKHCVCTKKTAFGFWTRKKAQNKLRRRRFPDIFGKWLTTSIVSEHGRAQLPNCFLQPMLRAFCPTS